MTEHTPGPWNILQGKTLLHVETDASAPEAGVSICSLPLTHVANANLIAAAPDLLAACELAFQVLRETPGGHGFAVDELDAALARARGEK